MFIDGAGAAAAADALAVPLYTLGVALLVATALFGVTKRARRAGSTWAS